MSEYLKKLTGKSTYTELHDAILAANSDIDGNEQHYGDVTVYKVVSQGKEVTFGVLLDFGNKIRKRYLTVYKMDESDFSGWEICETIQNLIAGNFEYKDKFDKRVTGRLQKEITHAKHLLTIVCVDDNLELSKYCNEYINRVFGCSCPF